MCHGVGGRITAESLEQFDALILLLENIRCRTVSLEAGRLTLVTRFGVGYDTVDVEACTASRHCGQYHP